MNPFPKVIRIEPSSICNLRCRHCAVGTSEDSSRQLMPEETFEKILKQIRENKEYAKVAIMYHGGEPLLNPKLKGMIADLNREGLKTKMDTNGMLLSEKKSVSLIAAGLNVLYVSIDGTTPKMNNWVRRGSSYEKIVENVKRLCELKKVFECNKPEIVLFNINFLKSARYENMFISQKLRKDFEGFEVSFATDKARKWHGLKPNKKYFKVFKTIENHRNYCDHVENTFSIRADGTVVPCCNDLLSSYPMGSIHKNSIAEIWNNKKYKDLRKAIKERKGLPPLCQNCKDIGPAEYLILKGGKKNGS